MSFFSRIKITDEYNFNAQCTPINQLRMAESYRLLGSIFNGTTLDQNFWTTTLGGSGTITLSNGEAVLATGATANSTVLLQTKRIARYVSASANYYRAVVRVADTGTVNNTRRWGAYSATDGFYFQLSGTTLSIGYRKASADTTVTQASWNGGNAFTLDTNVHTYEIYWTNSSTWFSIDGHFMHKASGSSAPLSGTVHLPVRIENNNTGGSITDVSMTVRTASINRLGKLETNPVSSNFAGAVAGRVLKYGPGVLQRVMVTSAPASGTVVIYDNTAASGTVICTITLTNDSVLPSSMDFNIPFNIGLTITTTGGSTNATIVYE